MEEYQKIISGIWVITYALLTYGAITKRQWLLAVGTTSLILAASRRFLELPVEPVLVYVFVNIGVFTIAYVLARDLNLLSRKKER